VKTHAQMAAGDKTIFGCMVESNINEGRQVFTHLHAHIHAHTHTHTHTHIHTHTPHTHKQAHAHTTHAQTHAKVYASKRKGKSNLSHPRHAGSGGGTGRQAQVRCVHHRRLHQLGHYRDNPTMPGRRCRRAPQGLIALS